MLKEPEIALNKRIKTPKHSNLEKVNIVQAKFTPITEDYHFDPKAIGEGGYGKVYRAIHKETNQMRAIKHIEIKKNLATSKSSRL